MERPGMATGGGGVMPRNVRSSSGRRVLDRLHELATALSGALTTAEVVAAAVSQTTAMFGAAGTVVARRASDANYLELLGAKDMPADAFEEWRRFPLTAPVPLAYVARTGAPLFLESESDWALHFPEMMGLLADAGHRANIIVPLLVEGRPSGALGIAFGSARRFSDEERALAITVARLSAVTLERAELYETERDARQRAEAAQAEAEHASTAKSAFVATMSHELRTPLNAIAGYTELLAMGIHGPVTEAQREALERIRRSGQHLLGLINDVLNFAKLASGSVRYEIMDMEISSAFDLIADLVAPQLQAKGLSPHHVRCEPPPVVRADPEKLRQILLNLFSNAIKFTDRGGTITTWCEVDRANQLALIHVADTGCGIPRDQLEHIFDPFVQVNRKLDNRTEGTGLGLSISRDLAHGMAGELTVTSEVGVGSTFTLRLPLAT